MSETLCDLIERNNILYVKFSDVPLTEKYQDYSRMLKKMLGLLSHQTGLYRKPPQEPLKRDRTAGSNVSKHRKNNIGEM